MDQSSRIDILAKTAVIKTTLFEVEEYAELAGLIYLLDESEVKTDELAIGMSRKMKEFDAGFDDFYWVKIFFDSRFSADSEFRQPLERLWPSWEKHLAGLKEQANKTLVQVKLDKLADIDASPWVHCVHYTR